MVERKPVTRRLLLFGVTAALVLALARLMAAQPDARVAAFDKEPEVRIGVALKVKTAELSLKGDYKVFNAAGTELARGANGTFSIELTPRPAPEVPGDMYRVSVGGYKSFEDASFAREKLAGMGANIRIAYPDQWYLWLGPFSSSAEARAMLDRLQASGCANARVESVPLGSAGFNVFSNGRLIAAGTRPVIFQSETNTVGINGKIFRGRAEVIPDAHGTLTVVNLVGVEDYLRGVVPKEMPTGAHSEALKAQAIIARTYLLNNRHRHVEDGFELCGGTDCQVYEGVGGEAASTDRAVAGTRGMVVAYNGRVANALFFSTSGGRTANYADVWTGDAPPYLASVIDGAENGGPDLSSESAFLEFLADDSGNDRASKYYRWTNKIEKSELQRTLADTIPKFANKPHLNVGAVRGIRIERRSRSGRVARVDVITEAGTFSFERDAIRWVFGGLRSTLFTLSTETEGGKEYYVFRGGGWGHGVGLCQMGAMQLAKDGGSTRDILAHYYPGASVEKLWK